MLVDKPAQVVVKLATDRPQAQGMGPGVCYATVEPRIMVQPKEVDPFLAISISRMFLEYRLPHQGTNQRDTRECSECQRQLVALEQQHTIVVTPGRFFRRTGDAVEVFECCKVTTIICTAEECHCDIPVHGQI